MKSRIQNPKSKIQNLLLGLCVLAVGSAFAALAPNAKPPKGSRVLDTKFLDINRWHLPFYNDGRWAIDITKTNYPGAYWPAPKKNFEIFGGGLWVGAITDKQETLVSVGYNPNSGANEFFPTMAKDAAGGSSNTQDRVYKYGTSDWPPPASRFGTDTALVPADNFSLQDMWMVFTDCRKDRHTSPGVPLGLEVYLTVYGWNYPSNQDIFFLKYKVKNVTSVLGTPTTLNHVYFGFCMDIDVGNATDDMCGMINNRVFHNGADTVRNVGMIGDNNNIEPDGSSGADRWEGGEPGTVCCKYLESPTGPDGKQLGMTAFKRFTLDIDPPNDADQYLTLAGIDYRTGIYNQYDSIDLAPNDKRMIECSGPFDLKADSVKTVVAAIFCAYHGAPGQLWPTRFDDADLENIVQTAQSAQFIYDRGWLLPGPPESPNMTLVPGDNKVLITWDNHSEVTPAKYYKVASDTSNHAGWDTMYKQYDFEGYKIWKSKDGAAWKLLKQCDLIDGDTWRDTTQADSIASIPKETGIFYSLEDDSVTNGFPYYYSVTAYCHNYSSGPIDTVTHLPKRLNIFLEGGRHGVSIIPRWNPANVTIPSGYMSKILGDAQTSSLLCSTHVVVPFRVAAGDTYILRFGNQMPRPTPGNDSVRFPWILYRKLPDSLAVVDTSGALYMLGAFSAAKRYATDVPTVGGLSSKFWLQMGFPTSASAFDSVAVPPGTYPQDTLKMGSMATSGRGKWAWRGSDYRVVWHNTGGVITASVYDLNNQPTDLTNRLKLTDSSYNLVPFHHYASTLPESANGWCFVNTVLKNPSDVLKRDSTALLYICGAYVQFSKAAPTQPIGALADNIHDGDVWTVFGDKSGKSAPSLNAFLITGAPEQVITKPDTSIKLLVRVVPNPYIITDAWEVNNFDRKVAFTGLPADCDIRVYTMAGDMVALIHHHQTKSAVGSQPDELGGTETWNLLNSSRQLIATGVYIYHVKSDVGQAVGKFAIVR